MERTQCWSLKSCSTPYELPDPVQVNKLKSHFSQSPEGGEEHHAWPFVGLPHVSASPCASASAGVSHCRLKAISDHQLLNSFTPFHSVSVPKGKK